MPSTHFRIQGKYFFLTYPRADFNIQEFLDWIKTKDVKSAIVCEEHHRDEGDHRHAAIEFNNRKSITSERYFDFRDYHPNIQKARSWKDVCNYVTKDGNYITFPENLSWGTEENALNPQDYQSEAEWLGVCLKHRVPYGYANRLWLLSRKDRGNLIISESSGEIGRELRDWDWSPEQYSTVIVGQTGIGKTSWAILKAPKPALLVTHMDELRKYDPEFHRSIIFDDMDFRHMPLTAQIHIVDHNLPRTLHARYSCAQIPAQTHKFFTCNEFPFNDHDAIKRRIINMTII